MLKYHSLDHYGGLTDPQWHLKSHTTVGLKKEQ